MTRRRDGFDLNDSVDLIRDNLGRADAFITAVDELDRADLEQRQC